jgi:hypothetical protein
VSLAPKSLARFGTKIRDAESAKSESIRIALDFMGISLLWIQMIGKDKTIHKLIGRKVLLEQEIENKRKKTVISSKY